MAKDENIAKDDCEVQGKNLVNTDYFMWLLWLFIVA